MVSLSGGAICAAIQSAGRGFLSVSLHSTKYVRLGIDKILDIVIVVLFTL